jgi:hypothetical protein
MPANVKDIVYMVVNCLLTFLSIARGSADEVRSMLRVMERMSAFENLKSEISNLKSLNGAIAFQLWGSVQHLWTRPFMVRASSDLKWRQGAPRSQGIPESTGSDKEESLWRDGSG